LVDADQVEARLQRLEQMLEQLEEVRSAGEEAYLADARQRLATERLLQLAIQICIDLGAQVVSEQSAAAPSNYSDVFKILGDKEVISADVAERLGNAARHATSWSISIRRSMTALCSPRWLISMTCASSPPLSGDWPTRPSIQTPEPFHASV
jgi:uncharacterized protein YutE (UPF0331/DUF86 family)